MVDNLKPGPRAAAHGHIAGFLSEGIIAGVGGVLVFCRKLFCFFILVLEDSGYLARAAFFTRQTYAGHRPIRARIYPFVIEFRLRGAWHNGNAYHIGDPQRALDQYYGSALDDLLRAPSCLYINYRGIYSHPNRLGILICKG